jgi:hypothetical protein
MEEPRIHSSPVSSVGDRRLRYRRLMKRQRSTRPFSLGRGLHVESENPALFGLVASALRASWPGEYVSTTMRSCPSSFPEWLRLLAG